MWHCDWKCHSSSTWNRSRSLHWRHNDQDSVSNHQPRGCLLNRLFRRRSKKTSKLRVTGLCAGNSPGPVNSQHKWPVTRKMFPFDDVIMCEGNNIRRPEQRAHDAMITSLWRQNDVVMSFWRHNDVIIALCVRWSLSKWNSLTIHRLMPKSVIMLVRNAIKKAQTDCLVLDLTLQLSVDLWNPRKSQDATKLAKPFLGKLDQYVLVKISGKSHENISGKGSNKIWWLRASSLTETWDLLQYPIRRHIVRSLEVSKPRGLWLESSNRPGIWQAPRQHCCRGSSQISTRCDNSNHQYRGFETTRDLTIRRLIGYWTGALVQAINKFSFKLR